MVNIFGEVMQAAGTLQMKGERCRMVPLLLTKTSLSELDRESPVHEEETLLCGTRTIQGFSHSYSRWKPIYKKAVKKAWKPVWHIGLTPQDWCNQMLAANLRSRTLHLSLPSSLVLNHSWKLGLLGSSRTLSSSAVESNSEKGLLDLNDIEKVLTDVRADDVKVIPAKKHAEWADYMAKQKQKGTRRMTLPSVEGQEGGKWIVIDSGKVIVHALDEKARAYYNLESLWTSDRSKEEPENLDKAFVKIRPKRNNSKKPANRDA
ncbi:unnamed protein product [Dovyalis caffra]|uniref:Uncharacterized protein n=1 Tax=Dovyalis caffra TaxID=77055 RepID=A0AAV1R232_9ROSI|nr:unnamed protein product [Dovyalis caffra]